MSDYKKMYIQLFNKVTNVIEELQEVQRQTENMYVESVESEIALLSPEGDTADSDHDEHKRKSPLSERGASISENGQKHK